MSSDVVIDDMRVRCVGEPCADQESYVSLLRLHASPIYQLDLIFGVTIEPEVCYINNLFSQVFEVSFSNIVDEKLSVHDKARSRKLKCQNSENNPF